MLLHKYLEATNIIFRKLEHISDYHLILKLKRRSMMRKLMKLSAILGAVLFGLVLGHVGNGLSGNPWEKRVKEAIQMTIGDGLSYSSLREQQTEKRERERTVSDFSRWVEAGCPEILTVPGSVPVLPPKENQSDKLGVGYAEGLGGGWRLSRIDPHTRWRYCVSSQMYKATEKLEKKMESMAGELRASRAENRNQREKMFREIESLRDILKQIEWRQINLKN